MESGCEYVSRKHEREKPAFAWLGLAFSLRNISSKEDRSVCVMYQIRGSHDHGLKKGGTREGGRRRVVCVHFTFAVS